MVHAYAWTCAHAKAGTNLAYFDMFKVVSGLPRGSGPPLTKLYTHSFLQGPAK